MATITNDVDQLLRDQLADAMTAYDHHCAMVTSLLRIADGKCACDEDDEDRGDCECDPDAARTEAGIQATLAQAAATMAQAMATLLAARPA